MNGSTTHSLNMTTRFLDLSFQVGANNQLTVDPPDNSNVLLPGYWMLFAFDDEGTPSVASTIKVGIGGEAFNARTGRYLTLSGDAAARTSGEIDLTPGGAGKSGAVMFNDPVNLGANASFAFDIFLGTAGGGTGITFVLHADRFGADAFGGFGGEGVANGLGIDFDTLNDGTAAGDIAADHSNFVDTDGPWQSTPVALPELDNGQWHSVVASWNAATRSFAYVLDGQYRGALTGSAVTQVLDLARPATFGFLGESLGTADTQAVRMTAVQTGATAGLVLAGAGGADVLTGGNGNDWLFGLGGNDRLVGRVGTDRMAGGTGRTTSCSARRGRAGSGRRGT